MRLGKIFLVLSLLFSPPARADMFGGDVAVLVQILANALKQLAELKEIVSTGQDTLGLLQDINRGINDSLYLASTINPNISPGLYNNWQNVSQAIQELTKIYGLVTKSSEAQVQSDTDRAVAEAFTMKNAIYEYSKQLDQIGELIKSQSHHVSPGGAQKLTAQSLGVMMHIQTETLRAQATGLKLQAQALAVQNRKDKEQSNQIVTTSEKLRSALTQHKPQFILPKF